MSKAKTVKPMAFDKPKISAVVPENLTAGPEIAETIAHRDPKTNVTITYRKGNFLGKGGFAKCYELIESTTETIVAGKIVPKALLVKSHQRDKMAQEIAIHRELCHVNIVKFLSFFEDEHFVYVTLELCRKRSMMELHKRRKALTEPEVRFYMKQIVNACCYLHDNRIIHRDLKLGNLFLNDDFQVKIGDFGLATRVEIDGERKKTLCGTPNYIAPEVLCKRGHSYEVDVWSLGCILYTLLVGKPPFETSSLKETYNRIKKNEYYIPSKVSQPAQMLIIKTLRPEPSSRPTMHEISEDKFLTTGFTPSTLPNSSLTMAPRFNSASASNGRRPLTEVNSNEYSRPSVLPSIPEMGKIPDKANQSRAVFVHNGQGRDCDEDPEQENIEGSSNDFYLSDMLAQLTKVIDSNPSEKETVNMDDAEDPALTPVVWVSKWVDYSDKYGLGYQLCDGSVGVSFNDATRLLMHEDGKSLEYIDKAGSETFFQLDSAPEALHKKKTLLEYFHHYMTEHLLKTGAHIEPPKGLDVARLPFLRVWFRTRSAIILHLNVGILQINFFTDHTKVIICPKMEAVSYIDEHRNFRTYKLELIRKHGCSRELFVRLRYAKTMVERLMKKLEDDCVRKPQS